MADLVDRLDEAAGVLDEALDAISRHYGCGHELFDRLVEARDAASSAAITLAAAPASRTIPEVGEGSGQKPRNSAKN
jgi:hypothetical protein